MSTRPRSILDGGQAFAARLAGRDPGTNIAVLRLDGGPQPAQHDAATEPQPGALVLALGADPAGGVAVRLGAVHSVGPAWHSRAGGRIDRRITLDLRLDQARRAGRCSTPRAASSASRPWVRGGGCW